MKQNCPKRGNTPSMGLTLTRAHRHTRRAHSHAGQTRDCATLPELNDSVWFLSLAMCMCINAADWDLCKSCVISAAYAKCCVIYWRALCCNRGLGAFC